jgi:hypothetical protein
MSLAKSGADDGDRNAQSGSERQEGEIPMQAHRELSFHDPLWGAISAP